MQRSGERGVRKGRGGAGTGAEFSEGGLDQGFFGATGSDLGLWKSFD